MLPHRHAPLPPIPAPKKTFEKGPSREPMAATRANTLPLVGPRGAESHPRGSDVETQIEVLQRYIAAGDCSGASEAAMDLAKKKAKLSIGADEIGDVPGNRSKFNLEVCVEDRHSSGAKIRLPDVIPNMTIGFLKKVVFQQYQFPIEVQRWIIGRRIIKDTETLMECRINSSTPVFLYLISAEKAGITREGVELSRQAMMAQQMQQLQQMQHMQQLPHMQQMPHMQELKQMSPFVMMPGSAAPPGTVPPADREVPRVSQNTPPRPPNRGTARVMRVVPPVAPTVSAVPKKSTALEVGWHCPRCTLINPPTIPGCRACLEERPEDYNIPHIDSYIMDDEEKAKQDELHLNERLMEESLDSLQELDQTLMRQGQEVTLNYLSD